MVVALAACSTSRGTADRPRELAQCEVSARSGEDVTKCLAISKNWSADSAWVAGQNYAARLDSITRQTDSLVQAKVDSIHAAADSVRRAAAIRRAEPWMTCALRQFRLQPGGPETPSAMWNACKDGPSLADFQVYVRARHVSDSLAREIRFFLVANGSTQ